MIDNSYYTQDVHGPYELYDIGNLELEEGGTIRACKLAYATFGKLNAAKDNAILIPTWYSGTNKIMEQIYIGQGRALDPDKYFIVVVNQIGNGLSTSPHNTPPPAGMGNFPHVRIGDDVRAQYKFVTEKFDLKSLALVVGGSMGAQQTYEWAVRYPDMVKRAAPIAGTAKNTIHDFLFTETLAEAITSDPGFNKGFYASPADVREGMLRQHHRRYYRCGIGTHWKTYWVAGRGDAKTVHRRLPCIATILGRSKRCGSARGGQAHRYFVEGCSAGQRFPRGRVPARLQIDGTRSGGCALSI